MARLRVSTTTTVMMRSCTNCPRRGASTSTVAIGRQNFGSRCGRSDVAARAKAQAFAPPRSRFELLLATGRHERRVGCARAAEGSVGETEDDLVSTTGSSTKHARTRSGRTPLLAFRWTLTMMAPPLSTLLLRADQKVQHQGADRGDAQDQTVRARGAAQPGDQDARRSRQAGNPARPNCSHGRHRRVRDQQQARAGGGERAHAIPATGIRSALTDMTSVRRSPWPFAERHAT